MNIITSLLFVVVILIFIASLTTRREGFGNHAECPTQLYQQNGEFILTHNGKKAKFANLNEYKYFVEAMRMRGIRCPVLYVEPVHDAQGGLSMKRMDDPITPTTGLMQLSANQVVKGETLGTDPAKRTDMPQPFDPENQQQGENNPIDKYFQVDGTVNPYSPDWKGIAYTEEAVEAGEMRGDEVYMT